MTKRRLVFVARAVSHTRVLSTTPACVENAKRPNPDGRFAKKPIVKSVAGDAREPFLYRTALWLRHRCVHDHP
jgi:hypothetical protein